VKEEDDALHAEPRALAEARHDVVRRAAVAARREAPAGPGEAALGQGGAATLFLAYAVGRACSAARVAARMVPMGLTSLKVRLSNPRDRRRAVEEELLVDSGAIFAVVPAPVLRRIGVRTHGKESFSLADGSRVSRSVGTAFFEIGARKGAATVIFGQPGDAPLLGALTLESLGLMLDPLRRKLRPLPSLLLSLGGAAPA